MRKADLTRTTAETNNQHWYRRLMPPRPIAHFIAAAALITSAVLVGAQPDPAAARISERFAKREVLVPMRDGVKLHAAIYEPVGGGGRRPILLTRTPYGIGPYGPDSFPDTLGPSPLFDTGHYVIVHQDVRGRFLSEGEWVEMRPIDAASRGAGATDESTDAWDTIEWLLAHVPRNNGRVGTWGVSYPGFYVSAGLVRGHPALAAASPQAPVTDYYMGDDAYHNGAFMLLANFGFYVSFYPREGGPSPRRDWTPFDYGTRDGYAFFQSMGSLANANARHLHGRNPYWNDVIAHTGYDEHWQARAVTPRLQDVRASVLTVGGWYDAEDLQGPLRLYRQIERSSPSSVNRLVMGPWTHGGWAHGPGRSVGQIALGSDTGAHYRERIEFPFFESALRGGPTEPRPEAAVFDTGRNGWREFEGWPPPGTTDVTYFFHADGRLDRAAPAATGGFDEYVSDPATPVPFIASVPTDLPGAWMTEDQQFAAARSDVRVYRGAPLPAPLTIAGPIRVTLHVSTTGTDSDFVVKVIDEYPEAAGDGLPAGFARLVRGEPFRGRFRRGFSDPQPFRPGEPDTIEFEMPDVFHTFEPGHRLVVHVQSSWFPLVDLNPQRFVNIPTATEADFQAATQRIYRTASRASGVTVGVVREDGGR